MRCLILPCETRVREFDAKLLLGLVAAARGVAAIVGSKKAIDLNLARYPDGVYIGKSVTARSRHNLALARSCGHRVALWDEEGLVWASREVYWRTKVDPATLNAPELLIAWGEDNARAWREHPDYRDTTIAVAGNPRADLLRPELAALFDEEVNAIAQRHGRFVLINTNFSRVNHLQPRQNRHLKWLREKRPDDPRGGFAAHKFRLFNAFLEMIPALATRLPEVRFVIRPHPSEDSAVWDRMAADLNNVDVNRSGNVVAWLLAADGLVHNGCTTAVEAFLLGRPALAYRPVRSADYDHPLPNDLSLSADSADELVELVAAANQSREALFQRQSHGGAGQVMACAVAGSEGGASCSSRILDALTALIEMPDPPPGYRPRLSQLVLGLRRGFRHLEHRLPGTANYRPYLEHMFPPVSLAEVQRRLGQMATCLGFEERYRVSDLGQSVFRITPS